MSAFDMDKAARVYIKIRDAKEAASAAAKKIDDDFKMKLATIEAAMLEEMKKMGDDVTSIRAASGTIMRGVKSKYWTSDFDAFRKFVLENADKEALNLFENRIAQKNMEQWISDHPDLYPPGVNAERRYAITIRRAKPATSHETFEQPSGETE